MKKSGWHGEKQRHGMASRGIKSNGEALLTNWFNTHGMKSKGYGFNEYLIDEIEDENYKLSILHDSNSDSPREWDNFGHMVCWHRRYSLGDEQPRETAEEWMQELKEQYGNKIEILPLFLYDHSGITMNTTGFSHMGMYGYFDSGQVGWIYVTHDEIKKEFGKVTKQTKEKALKILAGEVETYDTYLRGDVYGFVLEKRKRCDTCKHDEWDNVESCFGFYGDFKDDKNGMRDYIPDEAKKLFDKLIKESNKIF